MTRNEIIWNLLCRARDQADELNYKPEEALGDILGSLLYEIDAVLFEQQGFLTEGMERKE